MTAPDKVEDVIDAVLEAWVEEIILSTHLDPAHCILGTRVAIAVLDRFGIAARAQPVDITILNAQAGISILAGDPMPDDGYTLGTRSRDPSEPGRYSGHLIAYAAGRVVDLSGGQFNRPAHDIVVGPWAARAPLGFPAQSAVFVVDDVTATTAVLDPIEDWTYTSSPDWVKDRSDIIARVGRRVAARLSSKHPDR